ncbi:MAG: hypothetical protein K6E13_03375 [Lachnospiraceae bacterium]|nr:hypothetical protein [Lachnospiraceae bacterium]
MEGLIKLLKDGHARTIEMLALELDTTPADIKRKLEFLENTGIIKRVSFEVSSCGGNCGSCGGCEHSGDEKATCKSCMPSGEVLNMGEMWEVVGL